MSSNSHNNLITSNSESEASPNFPTVQMKHKQRAPRNKRGCLCCKYFDNYNFLT